MEADLVGQFKELLPRLIVYIIIPLYLGLQLMMLAQEERKTNPGSIAGSIALDFMALFFAVGVTAFIIISSLAILKLGSKYPEFMGGVFRYGLMFLFFGMWWQFLVIMSVKAYRDREKTVGKLKYLAFYAAGSVFVSLLAFIGSEWFLKYMSLAFLALASPLLLLPYRRMGLAFLAAAVVAFLAQAVGFIYVSSMI